MARPPLHASLALTALVSAVTSLLVVMAFLLLGPAVRPELGGWFGRFATRTAATSSSSLLQVPQNTNMRLLSEDEMTIQIVKKTQPAVVAVLVNASPSRFQKGTKLVPFPTDPFDPFNPDDSSEQHPDSSQIGGGSGFFVSSDGIVVTNKHVVTFDNAEYTVLTSDGKRLKATVLATDPSLDLGFLKVEGVGYPFLTFDDSDALVPGQTVIAIGNALDQFRNTVTKGVVSGLNRRIVAGDGADSEIIEEAIQTDAAINPGNSGGPLLNLNGNAVGLNTAVSEEGQLLGFALPSNIVKRDVESLQKFGRVVRPFLGVRYELITEDLVQKNQLPVDHGALIIRGDSRTDLAIAPGSPADKAGLVENDIILEVDGHRVDEEHSLGALIGHHAPGDHVSVKFLHAGGEQMATVTLDELKTTNP